ncbi:hypothetical protein KS4_30490 [Poriferisphaera corsica]|uniref:Uncharacterized protein n=1 Tax=Poriferisphaera corsica TaxID=2528020 RepID=A0A517YXL3_9BACT|nr:hypothetical protein [Poriferisphaera corsica]QDU34972.1 hypothetical protein KS4_30490 [Poriferisphaera corsica]
MKRALIFITFLLTLLTTAAAQENEVADSSASKPEKPMISPYSAAEQHLQAVYDSLTYLDNQLPVIAVAAEETALRLAADRKAKLHYVAPSTSFTTPSPYFLEYTSRPGSLLASRTTNPTHNMPVTSGDVTLLFLSPDTPTFRSDSNAKDYDFDGDTAVNIQMLADFALLIKQASAHQTAGSFIVTFAPISLIESMGMDIDAIPHDLLIDTSANPDSPSPLKTYHTTLPAGWTFYSELFCAATRHFRDNIPVVKKSFELDSRQVRFLDYIHTPYHSDRPAPDPIKPMALGGKYLKTLQNVVRDLQTASFGAIENTIDRMRIAVAEESRIYVKPSGPFIQYLTPVYSLNSSVTTLPKFPGIFTPWRNQDPTNSDFMIVIGDHEPAYSEFFGSWEELDRIKQLPLAAAWVLEGYNTRQSELKMPAKRPTNFPHEYFGDILIDKCGNVGDALINIPDYDTNLGPSSSFTSLTIYQTISMPFVMDD